MDDNIDRNYGCNLALFFHKFFCTVDVYEPINKSHYDTEFHICVHMEVCFDTYLSTKFPCHILF